MRTTVRHLVAAFVALLLCVCDGAVSAGVGDAYLQCKGNISIFPNSGPVQVVDNQQIAAHIRSAEINFSGSRLLLGENIQICTPSTDQPYFDSESCDRLRRKAKKRKYGTYNKITGALDLTNEVSEGNVSFVEGSFKCTKTEPLY